MPEREEQREERREPEARPAKGKGKGCLFHEHPGLWPCHWRLYLALCWLFWGGSLFSERSLASSVGRRLRRRSRHGWERSFTVCVHDGHEPIDGWTREEG